VDVTDRARREIDAVEVEPQPPAWTCVERSVDDFGRAGLSCRVDESADARVARCPGEPHELKHSPVANHVNRADAREAGGEQVRQRRGEARAARV
jgi:hypothetical protein